MSVQFDQSAKAAAAWRSPQGNGRRRGIGVLLVLLLIAFTLSLCYATVRTQNMGTMIQRNSDRRAAARQAALTGMAVAIKKMQQSTWAGFGTTLTGAVTTTDSYTATYAFGDDSLTFTSSDYNDYPFRGKISVTGVSVDSTSTQNISYYQITAVMHLTPRKLSSQPSDWSTMQQYTVYQTASNAFEIDIPCQLSGSVRLQGALKIAPTYPDTTDSWARYLYDLNSMRSGGYPDYRPFTGPVRYVYGTIDSKYLTALTSYLGVTASTLTANPAASDWVQPNSFGTYQLYTGGPTYTVPTVSNNLQSVTLGPDPMTNPLGIFFYNGNLTIKSNVTIKGSLYCKGNLTIDGTNVNFEPVELPGLFGGTLSLRLPTIVCKSLTVKNSLLSGNIKGLIAVFDTLTIEEASETQTLPITGRVIAQTFYIEDRDPWDEQNWSYYYNLFWYQRYTGIPYFPIYMGYHSRNPQPLLTIKPDTTSITYHWPTANSPVFLVNTSDGALRWEVIKWTETP